MTTWYWVRHAPTHQKNFVGWRDVEADLSDQSQLDRLSALLPDDAVIVSSDLTRCIDTANALKTGQRLRLSHQPGLREIHFGVWDGLHFSKVAERDPELSRAFWENPGSVTAPGGESWDMASERVNAVVDRLNARYPGGSIIAVAHFGAILTQVQRALGVGAYHALSYRIDNLSVTRIDWRDGNSSTAFINQLP